MCGRTNDAHACRIVAAHDFKIGSNKLMLLLMHAQIHQANFIMIHREKCLRERDQTARTQDEAQEHVCVDIAGLAPAAKRSR